MLNNVKCFLLDLDGTTYLDGKLIDGANEFFAAVEAKGKNYCFVTNNSSLSSQDYIKKLRNIGINARYDNVMTSGLAAIEYLNRNYYKKSVYLVGTESLREEFLSGGIPLVEENPDIVMLAFDTEITYKKIENACRFIKGGALYFATHPDINCPCEYGFKPDAGSFMALIQKSVCAQPRIVCGKPFSIMAEAVLKRFNLNPDQIAMVGDRLYTDIMFAINCGFVSVLVLSGETDKNMLKKSGLIPDITVDSIKDIIYKI